MGWLSKILADGWKTKSKDDHVHIRPPIAKDKSKKSAPDRRK